MPPRPSQTHLAAASNPVAAALGEGCLCIDAAGLNETGRALSQNVLRWTTLDNRVPNERENIPNRLGGEVEGGKIGPEGDTSQHAHLHKSYISTKYRWLYPKGNRLFRGFRRYQSNPNLTID